MNFKTLNIGCTQKSIFRSSTTTCSHFCWDESAGTVLLYDGYKYLYKYSVKDMKEEKRLNFAKISKEKHVQNVCHSQNFRVYFVLCDDLHMYVIKDMEFTYQTRFVSEIKYAIYLNYFDDQNAFVAITNEDVTYLSVNFKTNLFRATQYSNSITFECATVSLIQAHDPNCWNKGFSAQPSDRIILTWDINDVYIFDGNRKLKSMHKLRQIGSRDSIICCCLFIQSYDYLIVGYSSGEIKTWKIVPNNSSKKMLTYTFEAHARQVASLCRHATEPKIIVSAGLDHTIKFWDIDTFQYLFMFRAGGIYDEITLFSSSYFICILDHTISLGYFTGSLKFLYAHDSDVVGVDKTYSDIRRNYKLETTKTITNSIPAAITTSDNEEEEQMELELERVQLVLKNNSGLSIDCKSLEEYSYSKNVIMQPVALIYPPPVCKKIISMVTCPFRSDSFFIHIETGGFCRYTVKKTDENTVFYIENIITPDQFEDAQGHTFAHAISIIKFLEILPPNLDLDSAYNRLPEDVEDLNSKEMSEGEYRKRVHDAELMAFGSDKGSIIFVSLKGKFDKIYTRFSFHRDEVLDMCVVRQKHCASARLLVSFSREGILKVTNFTRHSIELLRSVEIGSEFDFMLGTSNKLALTTRKGGFKLFSLRAQTNEFSISEFEISSDHEKRILSIEVEPKRKLFLTAAKDNLIKIWSWKKLLLFQIKVPEKLTGATFVNSLADIAFFYKGRISLMEFKSIEADVEEGMQSAAVFVLTAKKAKASMEEYFNNGMNLDFNESVNQSFVALRSILSKPHSNSAGNSNNNNNNNSSQFMHASNRLSLFPNNNSANNNLTISTELKPRKLLLSMMEQSEDTQNQQLTSSPRSAKRPPSQAKLSPGKILDFSKLVSVTVNSQLSSQQQYSSQGLVERVQQRSSSKNSNDLPGTATASAALAVTVTVNSSPNVFEYPSASVQGTNAYGQSSNSHAVVTNPNNNNSSSNNNNNNTNGNQIVAVSPQSPLYGTTTNQLHKQSFQTQKAKLKELPELTMQNDWSNAYRIEASTAKSTYMNRPSLNNSSLRSSRNGMKNTSASSEKRTKSSSSGYQIYGNNNNNTGSSLSSISRIGGGGSSSNNNPTRISRNIEYSGGGGRLHTTSGGTVSPEVMKIYKPLTPNLEFVCITALPKKKPEKQQKKMSAAEKYHRERILFQNRAMPRYSTESSPFSRIIDYQPQSSFISVAIEPYNIVPTANPFQQTRRTPYSKANRSFSGLNHTSHSNNTTLS